MDSIAFSVEHQHEQIISYFDNETGLRAFLALHSTRRGPASGGTRIWHYSSTQEALLDALRLSEGMTYKAALAGLRLSARRVSECWGVILRRWPAALLRWWMLVRRQRIWSSSGAQLVLWWAGPLKKVAAASLRP